MSSYKNCCFTLNNYTEEEYETIKNWSCKYLVVGKEVGENGTPHLQGYVEWKSSKLLSTLKNLNNRIHWERRQGTALQASTYCKKDNDFIEIGTISSQGKRTDLIELKEKIFEGKAVDEVVLEDPHTYHLYGRTLNKIEELALRKKFRTEQTIGEWYYGETGVGKSHKAFEGFHPDTHYVYPYDNGWWDGYKGQDIVIINDFRGQISYGELLNLVDKWPHQVRRRNREPLPFISKKVIITSSIHPDMVYKNLSKEDKLDQLYRRFKIEELFNSNYGGSSARGNTIPVLENE